MPYFMPSFMANSYIGRPLASLLVQKLSDPWPPRHVFQTGPLVGVRVRQGQPQVVSDKVGGVPCVRKLVGAGTLTAAGRLQRKHRRLLGEDRDQSGEGLLP